MTSLAQALEQQGRGDLRGALASCRAVLERAPRDPEALNLMGILLTQSGQLAEGCRTLQAAVAMQPENPNFLGNLGRALLMAGALHPAEAACQRAVKLQPALASAWMTLGQVQLRADRVEEAEVSFATAVLSDPQSLEALEGRGFALQRLGRQQDAIAVFESCLALEPNNPSAQANLAGLFMETGKPADAVRLLKSACALAPNRPDLQSNLAAALYAYGDRDAGLLALESCLTLAPFHARALGLKGLWLWEAGRHDEAQRLFDYEGLVFSRQLHEISGYENLTAFNNALRTAVLADRSLVDSRAGKTTRGGRQSGELFNVTEGPFAALRVEVATALEAYFETLQANADLQGPLKPQRARLTAWSTVLRSGGYQDPHNHPSGRVSGVYYVQLPPVIGAEGDDDQGFIEFGAANKRLGVSTTPPVKLFQPKVGSLFLFPSYFWHRTLPFESAEDRISIAFDLIPESRQ